MTLLEEVRDLAKERQWSDSYLLESICLWMEDVEQDKKLIEFLHLLGDRERACEDGRDENDV